MPESFVYFQPSDYARPSRRVVAAGIDLFILMLCFWTIGFAVAKNYVPLDVQRMPNSRQRQELINQHMRPIQRPMLGGYVLLAAMYHILMGRTPGGTFGHRLVKTRVVDATGTPPPLAVLVKRFLIGTPLVVFFGVSYLLCMRSPRRQAIHDQCVGTWVIRASAKPAGTAQKIFICLPLGPFPLNFVDIEPLVQEPPAVPETPVALDSHNFAASDSPR